MSTTLYGISNCDTIKKAKKWLEQRGIEYTFHDYRKDGLSEEWLSQTATRLGWENLLNKRGTTFRQLSEEEKTNLDERKALALLLANPAMIKRPVLIHNSNYHLAFKPAQYEEIFAS
ncbi:ArsC family reductase [Aestuariibacter sp. A3R04]|uniref:ArsC family reductase n=1 Tax=Aestuariibacter sp. A3R04 TaxID=2841571 RepID=UPI001C08904E|nr:ArsC family reductase [Aestuariibacter sp. A3R04]MBU3022608.1 ArsC family reductase [Aestuariibacter sp. A3R04]